MSEQVKHTRFWNRPLPSFFPWILLLGFVLFLLAMMLPSGVALIQIVWAAIAGWLLHGLRVLPVFVGKWQGAMLPLSMVLVAWWVGHGLLRWYLQSSGSRLAERWTLRLSGALLALVLFGAAAAVSISGVAHQAMWLGQTKWVETSGVSLERRINMTLINLWKVMWYYDSETGKLPASMDELMEFLIETDLADPALIHTQGGNNLYVPMLTKPGAVLAELPPNMIVLISNPVDGLYFAMLANGQDLRITPQELDEIIARGDWLYHETP